MFTGIHGLPGSCLHVLRGVWLHLVSAVTECERACGLAKSDYGLFLCSKQQVQTTSNERRAETRASYLQQDNNQSPLTQTVLQK